MIMISFFFSFNMIFNYFIFIFQLNKGGNGASRIKKQLKIIISRGRYICICIYKYYIYKYYIYKYIYIDFNI